MNPKECFQLACLIAGLLSSIIAVLYRMTATNRPDKDRYLLIGASAGAFGVAVTMFCVSIIIKSP